MVTLKLINVYNADEFRHIVDMESLEDGSCIRKPYKLNCDSDNSKNFKGVPKQRGLNENVENVFCTSDAGDTNYVTSNDSQTRYSNCSSNVEAGPSSKLTSSGEASSNKNINSANQSSIVRVNNSHLETASCSKADCGTRDNGIVGAPDLQTCQRHKVCQEKAGNNYNVSFPSTSTSRICDNFNDSTNSRRTEKGLQV